jgi:hypothetical protein
MHVLTLPIAARFAVYLTFIAGTITPAFAQTTINFDDVADKSDVRTQYQARGVTFSCDGSACSSPSIANGIYARATTPPPSTPNSVTPIKDGFPGVRDAVTGRVVATFSSPVKTVSIDARAVLVPEPLNQTAYANMIAYNANGATVGTTTGTQLNTFETLTISTSSNQITRVSLGVSGAVAVATFDNLRFEGDPNLIWVWFPIFIIILVIVYWFFKRKKDLPRPPITG